MTKNERLDKLKDAGDEYIKEEKKRLEKEYDFLDDILDSMDHGSLQDSNSDQASTILVNAIKDFLLDT